MIFQYGSKETDYLTKKDKKLGEVIRFAGHLEREVDPDLFSAVVHQIIGQQISAKALETVWRRITETLGTVDAQTVLSVGENGLQKFGLSFRKARYITEFAQKVSDGSFDLDAVWGMTDEQAIRALTSLKGIGVWTAEMILLFCMQRPDILSFDDLAIRRGICMIYHHRTIDRERFERYRRRFSPYGSVASFYIWAVANGLVEGLEVNPSSK